MVAGIGADNPPSGGRILFTSYHFLLDPSSGAAISAREMLQMLAAEAWTVRAFTGPILDFEREESVAQVLADRRLRVRTDRGRVGDTRFCVLRFRDAHFPVAVYLPGGATDRLSREAGSVYLHLLRKALDSWRPDVVITYGGDWLGTHVLNLARSRGAKTVFWLRNFAYQEAGLFALVDMTIVPSKCSHDHYREALGIDSVVLPSPIDWDRVLCTPSTTDRYVTFVNPQPHKGVFVFARIAQQLSRIRPDIPLLVVEGRGGPGWLTRTGVDLSECRNVHAMNNTPDPRDFYRASRIILMPSLWRESFGRVAAEAMINSIPVVASDRGALPEVLDGAGRLLHVPQTYTPQSRQAPTAEEVRPWCDAIIRLWDDPKGYEIAARRCRARAEAWRPDVLRVGYGRVLERLLHGASTCAGIGGEERDETCH